jgi:hypothetical protein
MIRPIHIGIHIGLIRHDGRGWLGDDYLAPDNLRNRIQWETSRLLFNTVNSRFENLLRN